MSMTREEKETKAFIREKLAKSGYPTYAKLLSYFDLNLTNNPKYIAFLQPEKGRIVVNRGLDEDQASVVIRHEILHDYLKHEERLLRKLAKEAGLDYDDLVGEVSVDELSSSLNDLKQTLYQNQDFNYAADYEISNRGYTDRDKETIREINVNGRTLRGLVTEDDHADWVDLSVEEMFDKLREERQKQANKPPEPVKYAGKLMDSKNFMDLSGVIHGV